MRENNKKFFNENNLMRALMSCPLQAYELARSLGSAIDAYTVYTSVCTRPDRLLAMQSKKGLAIGKGRICIGIICTMQKKVGLDILLSYIKDDDEVLEFIQDLDDFIYDVYKQPEKAAM